MKIKKALTAIMVVLAGTAAMAQEYPKIDVTGYKKWEYRDAQVDPQRNYFSGLTQLGGFSPTSTGGPWQERLQLRILGQLNEQLSVSYDVEQQPEQPDKYDVKVSYDNKHELTFGDFTATFAGNEFASATKFLNGVMITSKDTNYDLIAVPSAKLKSQVQGVSSQKGNNTKGPYSLGHGSIVEGSERIELNGAVLERGKDYIIDYFEGKVTFMRILTEADEFKYSFEYTNLLDLFFPALSKKDFFGVQGRVTLDPDTWGRSEPRPQPVMIPTKEVFPSSARVVLVPRQNGGTGEAVRGDANGYLRDIEESKEERQRVSDYAKQVYQQMQESLAQKRWTRATQFKELYEGSMRRMQGISDRIRELEELAEKAAQAAPPPAEEGEVEYVTREAVVSEDVMAEESAGRYKLAYFPIVPFSEVLTFKGTVLKKNEDYAIRYEDGRVTLTLPVLPAKDDPLEIEYQVSKTDRITDSIAGNGGPGPYALSRPHVVPQSERIYVNERLSVRDFDYSIDYVSGRVNFNYQISTSSMIRAAYLAQVRELPPAPLPPRHPRSLTVGMTYLKEASKKSVASAVADYMDTRTGTQLLNSDRTIYLSRFPMATTAEGGTLLVRIDGRDAVRDVEWAIPTVEVDSTTGYARVIPSAKLAYITDRMDTSDGYYTGTVKILASVEATSEVTVVYTYKKNIVGRYSGVGNGSRGPYYLRNIRNVVPGSERVEVWTQGSQVVDTYVRNSSFEADAGDKGYSFNYTADNPYITFNRELDPTQNYSIYYQYIAPQSASTGDDIQQDLAGFDAAVKVGELFQFNTNFARSSTDQVINAVGTNESFSKFTIPTNRLTLTRKPVIENSEKIFVNTFLVNRDSDYFIDYSTGSITFYYITLSTNDAVSVDYQYQSAEGVDTKVTQKVDTAYKYGVKSTVGNVSVAYNNKAIGYDFNPLGGTAIGIGSNYSDFMLDIKPLAHDLKGTYSYQETNNPIGTTRKFYSRNYNRNYTGSVNPFGLMGIGFNYRNQESRGDPRDIGGDPTADSSLNAYSLSLVPAPLSRGPFTFTQTYGGQRSLSEDRLNFRKGEIQSGNLGYGIGFTDRVRLSSALQVSEPRNTSIQTGEVLTGWTMSRDLSYDMSVDLTFPRVHRLSTYARQIKQEFYTFYPTPESRSEVRNTSWRLDFVPIPMLTTSYDYNRQETPTVVYEGRNPMSERTATNIRVTPHPALSGGWGYSEDFTVNEQARESSGRSNTYNAQWTPISWQRLRVGANYTMFSRQAMTPSGTLETHSDNRTFTQDYFMTFTPIDMLSLTPGIVQEDYFNATSTSTVELRTVNQTVRMGASFRPTPVLRLDGNYNLKVTNSLTDNIARHKTLVNMTAGYRVFSWGELIYTLEDEHNMGEIQAGGTLPDLDYLKTTSAVSFAFDIPQENPILSGIQVKATYKAVKYENRKRAEDDLTANMLTFEGILNF